MREIFVDSANHIAVFNDDDQLHARAMEVGRQLGTEPGLAFVTTESVLVEFLAFFSRMRPRLRLAAADYVDQTRSVMTVLPQPTALFDAGLDLYRRRADKTYSMVDCMSMALCRERDIQDILTADRDFEQEGFTLLL